MKLKSGRDLNVVGQVTLPTDNGAVRTYMIVDMGSAKYILDFVPSRYTLLPAFYFEDNVDLENKHL